MHRELKVLLQKATGRSEFIIVVMIDIRGFTGFSMSRESSETAVFLKKVYQIILDKYFPEAAFFKPTGDGLMIIVPYTEESLKESCVNTVKKCLDLISSFPTLCNGDPSIYFDVPRKLGIGLSRGAATCLTSGDKVLDYSGRVLNLANRLVDIARPCGIVCDERFGIELMPDELKNQFSREDVYLRSIAERTPKDVYLTKGHTIVPSSNRQPLEKVEWTTERAEFTMKEIVDHSPRLGHHLRYEPLDPRQIEVIVKAPSARKGEKERGWRRAFVYRGFTYRLDATKLMIILDTEDLSRRLESIRVGKRWGVLLQIKYPKK